MLAKVKEDLGWSYFQARFHAYVELSWYFGLFCVLGLISAIWAAAMTDKDVIRTLPTAGAMEECGNINMYLRIAAYVAIAEMGICFLLTVGLPNIMRSANWALFSLISFSLICVVYLGKLAVNILGMVFIWSVGEYSCETLTPSLYNNGSNFLVGQIIIFIVSLLAGTAFLLCFGLEDAINEAMHICKRKYGSKDEDLEYDDAEDITVF